MKASEAPTEDTRSIGISYAINTPAMWFIQLQSQAHGFPWKSRHLWILANEVEKSNKTKNGGQILTESIMENPALWDCKPNKLECREISRLKLVPGRAGTLFYQPSTNQATPCSSVWGPRGSSALSYGLNALFTNIWCSSVSMCLYLWRHMRTYVHTCGTQRSTLDAIPHETPIEPPQTGSHTGARVLPSRLGGLASQLWGSNILHCFLITGLITMQHHLRRTF